MKFGGQVGMRPSSRTGDRDALFLPPLPKSGKALDSVGLRQMKLPGGADMWSMPTSSIGSRTPRFREWVAQSTADFERDAAVWEISSNAKTLRPKFQSAFSSRPSASSSKRSKSAISNIRAAYLKSEDGEAASTVGTVSSATADDGTRLKQELAQLQTGDDAVKFFARHGGNSQIKVLYCNRVSQEEECGSAPYRLVVVPEHKVKPEHFTISASGVFHICPGEMSECTPLSEWIHHGMMYSVLTSMPFFKMYTIRKNFDFWRSSSRHEAFCRQRQRLSRNCFLANPLFARQLATVHRLVNDVKELPLLNLCQDHSRLVDFCEMQIAVRSNPSSGARAQLERKYDKLLDVLCEVVKSVHQACSEDAGGHGRSRSKSKAKSMVQEKQDARERAKRQQLAARDIASLGSFVRLADYMFQGARVACILEAAHTFCKRLDSGQRMFTVDAYFEEAGVVLQPSRDAFSQELHSLWDGALQAVSSVPALAAAAPLRSVAADPSGSHTVEEIIHKCRLFNERCDHIDKVISEQLGAAQQTASEQYMRFYHIFEFGAAWNEDAFVKQNHTVESLSKQMSLMSSFQAELSHFRLHRTVGAIFVHGASLRSLLEPIPDRGLMVTGRLLTSMVREKCSATLQHIGTTIKALEERPSRKDGHILETFKRTVAAADAQVLHWEDVCQEIETSFRLLMKHGVRLSVGDNVDLEALHTRRRDLDEVKLPQAKLHLESLNRGSPEITVTVHVSPSGDHEWSMVGEERTQREIAREGAPSESVFEASAGPCAPTCGDLAAIAMKPT